MAPSDKQVTITVAKEALDHFWESQEAVYNCMGPAADDVFESIDEAYPRAHEFFDALRAAS